MWAVASKQRNGYNTMNKLLQFRIRNRAYRRKPVGFLAPATPGRWIAAFSRSCLTPGTLPGLERKPPRVAKARLEYHGIFQSIRWEAPDRRSKHPLSGGLQPHQQHAVIGGDLLSLVPGESRLAAHTGANDSGDNRSRPGRTD